MRMHAVDMCGGNNPMRMLRDENQKGTRKDAIAINANSMNGAAIQPILPKAQPGAPSGQSAS